MISGATQGPHRSAELGFGGALLEINVEESPIVTII